MTADEIKALGHIPLLTLRGVMIVPQGTTPLLIGRPRSVASVQQVEVGDHIICIPQRDDKVDDPIPTHVLSLCCAACAAPFP